MAVMNPQLKRKRSLFGRLPGGDLPFIFFVQDNTEETAMNRQPTIVVIHKTKFTELVHEMTDPRPGGTDHLGQVFLINSRMDSFYSAFLAKTRQQ